MRRLIGVMDAEGPAEAAGEILDGSALAPIERLIVVLEGFGAAKRQVLRSRHFGKFRAAAIGESLLGRVGDLHEVTLLHLGRDRSEPAGNRRKRIKKIAEQNAYGK